jgi:Mg-chelatase subunit ChlD
MRVIRHFIDFRKEETEILIDIIKEVREIKDEVKKTFK